MSGTETITVLFYSGKGWISRFIRWQTRSRFSHVAVQFADGWTYESIAPKGVQKHHGQYPGVVNELSIEVSPLECCRMREWAESKLGMKYDWVAILRFISRKNWQDNDRWICSEYVAGIFHAGCLDLQARTELWKMSPELVWMSPLLNDRPFEVGE